MDDTITAEGRDEDYRFFPRAGRSKWESKGARCIGEHQVCTVEPNEFSQLLDQGILRGLKNSDGAKIGVIASGKLEKGGRGSNSETVHATLRVNESRPAELGQQPEARLAWGRATVTAKPSDGLALQANAAGLPTQPEAEHQDPQQRPAEAEPQPASRCLVVCSSHHRDLRSRGACDCSPTHANLLRRLREPRIACGP
jgi:hypothetical protein